MQHFFHSLVTGEMTASQKPLSVDQTGGSSQIMAIRWMLQHLKVQLADIIVQHRETFRQVFDVWFR
jgi:hypothetical protein